MTESNVFSHRKLTVHVSVTWTVSELCIKTTLLMLTFFDNHCKENAHNTD